MNEAEDGSAAVAALKRFYAAEGAYMAAGGGDFAPLAATLHPEVVLHQSPDLPWGDEYRGHAGYEDWARQMSAAFDQLDVKELRLFARGDTVVAACRLITRSRTTGAVVDAPMTQVVTIRDDLIVDFRPFYWNVPAYRSTVVMNDAECGAMLPTAPTSPRC